MTYENWKVSIKDLQENKDLQNEYEIVANWCTDSGKYQIQEVEGNYCVVNLFCLDKLKEFKKDEINNERDNARKIEGAEYDGDIFDIDEVSQSNILAQIKVAEIIGDPKATYNYRSKTNTDHLFTLTQLQELGLAITGKVNAIYVKSWDLKARVDMATTEEEVESIKWTSA